MPETLLDRLPSIADRFAHQGNIISVEPFGSGNINDTFLVTLDDVEQTRFVLQRINTQVFRQPQWVMQNMSRLTRHIGDRLQNLTIERRWETPHVILTAEAQDHWCDEQGSFWRAISFIEGSASFDQMHDIDHAWEVGYGLGMFHRLISDLPPDQMADTLEGFHITPQYLQQYDRAIANTSAASSPELDYGIAFVRDRSAWCSVLETAKAQGKLPLRLMHGDPKVNNILFDAATGKAVSVIDLDTVKPGLVHYDIGDCLRSGCNPAGEETQDWEQVYFEPELCKALLGGYFSEAKAFLNDADYEYLFDAIRLIAFELGLRFLADHLAGNVYFKVRYPEHNLMRSLVQFKLTESIEAQEATLRTMIGDMR